VPKKTGTIHIKWIRSGIGFSRKQKEVVRSIGLHRLNQVVERPDSAHFRGLVAKVCHLVAVVEPLAVPAWTQVPEYKITPAELKVAAPSPKKAVKKAPAEAPAAAGVKAAPPAKKAAAAKSRAAKSSTKETAKGSEKAKPKRKAAAPKAATAAKKESKPKKGKK
jgi:large subunit ribosomal protein L30